MTVRMVEKLGKFDKFIEVGTRLVGGWMFIHMYINDRGMDLTTLSGPQMIYMGSMYAIAIALLKGFTKEELIRLARIGRKD